MGERLVESLEAPLDLVPRAHRLRFEGLDETHTLIVTADPANEIRELNEDNNRVILRTPVRLPEH